MKCVRVEQAAFSPWFFLRYPSNKWKYRPFEKPDTSPTYRDPDSHKMEYQDACDLRRDIADILDDALKKRIKPLALSSPHWKIIRYFAR